MLAFFFFYHSSKILTEECPTWVRSEPHNFYPPWLLTFPPGVDSASRAEETRIRSPSCHWGSGKRAHQSQGQLKRVGQQSGRWRLRVNSWVHSLTIPGHHLPFVNSTSWRLGFPGFADVQRRHCHPGRPEKMVRVLPRSFSFLFWYG